MYSSRCCLLELVLLGGYQSVSQLSYARQKPTPSPNPKSKSNQATRVKVYNLRDDHRSLGYHPKEDDLRRRDTKAVRGLFERRIDGSAGEGGDWPAYFIASVSLRCAKGHQKKSKVK